VTVDHVALWVRELDAMADFYASWFGGSAGPEYRNAAKGFASRFVDFGSGARLELMRRADRLGPDPDGRAGWAHLCFSAGGRDRVDALAAAFRAAGVTVADGPRLTGDGYYELVVLDPEGNRVELTA